jgi:hypothetical protein
MGNEVFKCSNFITRYGLGKSADHGQDHGTNHLPIFFPFFKRICRKRKKSNGN